MKHFIDQLALPHSEPVLFAGDFNTDNVSFAEEVSGLVSTIKAHMPKRGGDQLYTSNPHSNLLVGRDGAATSNKCLERYEASWGSLVVGLYR